MSEAKNFKLSTVTNRYAVAMIELAQKHDMFDVLETDLYLIKEILQSSKDLNNFIEHPLIKIADKKDVFEKIFKEHVCGYSMNLIRILADKNRLFILQYIYDYYHKLLCAKRNVSTAQVITAIYINEVTISRIQEKLEKLFNKNIKIEPKIDQNIIAGMIVKIDDHVIDGSIRTRFENMKKQLIKG